MMVVRGCWHTGVTNLMNMAAFWRSYHIIEATHCVIGVNPKIIAPGRYAPRVATDEE